VLLVLFARIMLCTNWRKIQPLGKASGKPSTFFERVFPHAFLVFQRTWLNEFRDGKEILQRLEPIPQGDYQKSLDQGTAAPQLSSETVRFWSDYNRVFYHPRSIVQLNDFELNSNIMPFEEWGLGEELFNDLDKEHDLLDRDVRPFAEECDQLRALQIFTGSDDAWGGFAARYVDRLVDEYGKKAVLVWAIEDGKRVHQVSYPMPNISLGAK
jgi:hypothetical protein